MCSHPIVQATQLARVRLCVCRISSGEMAGGPVERAGLKVARRQCAEAIERQQIGGRAELAVLGRSRAERAFRQRLAVLGQLARLRPLAALRAAHGDRLDVLAAEHGAAAAASGVAAVVRDRRVADQRARRPDRSTRPDSRRRVLLSAPLRWQSRSPREDPRPAPDGRCRRR